LINSGKQSHINCSGIKNDSSNPSSYNKLEEYAEFITISRCKDIDDHIEVKVKLPEISKVKHVMTKQESGMVIWEEPYEDI